MKGAVLHPKVSEIKGERSVWWRALLWSGTPDRCQIYYFPSEHQMQLPCIERNIIRGRAISVLEGIALVGDPQFAIVDEAYPYVAKRLLTDKSPRLQAALRYMVRICLAAFPTLIIPGFPAGVERPTFFMRNLLSICIRYGKRY